MNTLNVAAWTAGKRWAEPGDLIAAVFVLGVVSADASCWPRRRVLSSTLQNCRDAVCRH